MGKGGETKISNTESELKVWWSSWNGPAAKTKNIVGGKRSTEKNPKFQTRIVS